MSWRPPIPACGRGTRPDLRRTVRRALRSGGEPVRPSHLEPSDRPRRVILLCDVSGSMEPYSRALVRFLHAAVTSRQRGRVEAFALGTRLTRITTDLVWSPTKHWPANGPNFPPVVSQIGSVADWPIRP